MSVVLLSSLLAMGACATKPGDLKVKGDAPLVVEDAAAPLPAADEKTKAAEVDQADVSRRRSLSVLLKQVSNFIPFCVLNSSDSGTKLQLSRVTNRCACCLLYTTQDAEATDGEADQQEADKVVGVAEEEPASAAAAAAAGEETMGSPQAPVQATVDATTEHDGTAEELKDDDLPSGDAHAAAEEEKRVDPESVHVAAVTVTAAAPSSEESKVAAADAAAAPISEESKVADDDGASA